MTVLLSNKPSRPFLGGLYKITQDGYVICAKRRSTTLKGAALRPALEYGNLVYRITVNGKTTSIRAFLVVREIWGTPILDSGDYKEMVRTIDAYNTWLKETHRSKMSAKTKAKSRGICPYCGKAEIKRTSMAKTCGSPKCMSEHRRRVDRARHKLTDHVAKHQPKSNKFGEFCMPCPWSTPGKLSVPEAGVSWYSAQADPMTRGVWITDNVETRREKQERRAA